VAVEEKGKRTVGNWLCLFQHDRDGACRIARDGAVAALEWPGVHRFLDVFEREDVVSEVLARVFDARADPRRADSNTSMQGWISGVVRKVVLLDSSRSGRTSSRRFLTVLSGTRRPAQQCAICPRSSATADPGEDPAGS